MPHPTKRRTRTLPASRQSISTLVFNEPQPRPSQGWTPGRLKVAERLADNGDLSLAADLAELIIADDQVSGLVSTLGGVASLPLAFQPPGVRTPSEIAKALEADWPEFTSAEIQTEVIGWLRVLGVSFVHVRKWVVAPSGHLVPELEVWHPRNFRFAWGNEPNRPRGWYVRLGQGREERIEPGDGRWIIFTAYDQSRPWSKAPWRSLSRWWLLKQYAIADWGFFSNRHGSGLIVASNQGANVSVTPEARKELSRDLQKLGRNGVVALPDGFDLKLVESIARTWETFVQQIDMANMAASIALTGNNLSSKVEGGSYAAASVHERVTQGRIRSIAAALSGTYRNQLLVWYVALNFGSTEEVPAPHWDVRPPIDQTSRANVYLQLSQAQATFDGLGLRIPAEALEREFGIVLEEVERPEPKAPPLPPGAPKDDGEDGNPSEEDDDEEENADRAAFLERAQAADEEWATALADSATEAGAESLAPQVDELLAVIQKAESPKELYSRLVDYYSDMNPAAFVDVVDRATVLASLRGRRAATRDV